MIWLVLVVQGAMLWWVRTQLRDLSRRIAALPQPEPVPDHSEALRELTDSVSFLMAPGKVNVTPPPTSRQLVRPMGVR